MRCGRRSIPANIPLASSRSRPLPSTTSPGLERRAVRALLPQHLPLVTLILACQLVLCTLAAYAFARYEFPGSGIAFALVLAQLMIMPDVLIVENYKTMGQLGILDSIPAIALPYVASAFGVFLLRQPSRRCRRSSTMPRAWKVPARCNAAEGLRAPGAAVYLATGSCPSAITGTTSCGR